MPHRITLVGYRACGKSTIGRLLAARLAWPFVDADQAAEARLGCSIAEVFRTRGEAAFRDLEQAVIADLLAGDGPLVLATGGGAVLREANRTCLRERGGLVVYLQVEPTVVQDRLRHHHGGRPSLTGGSLVDEVPAIMAARDPWYRATATHLEPTAGRSASDIAQRLADLVASAPA